MIWMTFNEWVEDGYSIIKGSKSALREPKSGLPLFNEKQVSEMEDRRDYAAISDMYPD